MIGCHNVGKIGTISTTTTEMDVGWHGVGWRWRSARACINAALELTNEALSEQDGVDGRTKGTLITPCTDRQLWAYVNGD